MLMKSPVLEAVRMHCQQNGTHFAALARRMKVKRTSIYRLLSGTVTDKAIDKVATALNLTRPEFERWLLSEWQRALASGCEATSIQAIRKATDDHDLAVLSAGVFLDRTGMELPKLLPLSGAELETWKSCVRGMA